MRRELFGSLASAICVLPACSRFSLRSKMHFAFHVHVIFILPIVPPLHALSKDPGHMNSRRCYSIYFVQNLISNIRIMDDRQTRGRYVNIFLKFDDWQPFYLGRFWFRLKRPSERSSGEREERRKKSKTAVVSDCTAVLPVRAPVYTNTNVDEGIRESHRGYTWMHSSLGVHADYP